MPPVSLAARENDDDAENGKEVNIPVPPEQAALIERIALYQCLSLLREEERQIIILRYLKNKTQTEVGMVLGMSQVQVSRKEKKALKALREMLEK